MFCLAFLLEIYVTGGALSVQMMSDHFTHPETPSETGHTIVEREHTTATVTIGPKSDYVASLVSDK